MKQSNTLLYVTKGFLGFSGSDRFPREWREGATEETRLLFFGVVPGWRHRLTFQEISDAKRELATCEGGGLVPIWNHLIKVEELEGQACRYTDDVEIQAGPLTLLVWLYANVFYRYRQWRWRSLLKRSA
ncbi:hypothetical protein [Alkalilimnicola ehrlichii]|uniref:hypothetical protein n=1 Tax=Alkalilimnicola ehrlichii TaxID=351052 RepID=UPI001C6E80F1|nr:hypothetical protein [Alkalilimnicola ehrlichii]